MTPPPATDAEALGVFADEVAAASQALLDRATTAQGRRPGGAAGRRPVGQDGP
ncbi:MAG TPA: hypothetical protein VFP50_19410 [Anaeromyxobacteraceae bacterium]|nr:hypothetical protein [Anaeromyxobacteraceae bacterium]